MYLYLPGNYLRVIKINLTGKSDHLLPGINKLTLTYSDDGEILIRLCVEKISSAELNQPEGGDNPPLFLYTDYAYFILNLFIPFPDQVVYPDV